METLTQEQLAARTAKCRNNAAPPCQAVCPLDLDVRSLAEKCEKGRWLAAYKVLRKTFMFPKLVSELCPAPCEGKCTRNSCGGAIDLHRLEQAAVRYTKEKDRRPELYALPPRSEKIAVIGAGIAGLTLAITLSQKKFSVTVFERQDSWGGILRDHPKFADFDAEFAVYFAGTGVDFRYNHEVSALSELDSFDAIYIATGASAPGSGNVFLDPDGYDRSALWFPGTNVFMGGGAGTAHGAAASGERDDLSPMQSIADGKRASLAIETYLQTKKATPPAIPTRCAHVPDTHGAEIIERVRPESGDYFTEDEAKSEAARCFRCDCVNCMNGCEMLRRFHKFPKAISSDVYTDTRAVPPFAAHTITREAYSCNDCGYCGSVCPESIDSGELLRLSRRARVASGTDVPALHDYWLREMDFSVTDGAYASENRCEYVFFPGCQLGAYNPEHVTRSLEVLRRNFDVGMYQSCCGAPAYWAGDDRRLDANTAQIRETWRGLGEPTFIFACATCQRVFTELLPEIPRVTLYEMLAKSGNFAPPSAIPDGYETAAIFDPCSARADDDMRSSVRALAKSSGIAATELAEPGKCCGYGGHIRLANPSLFEEITENRVAASGEPYIVYCANCREVFSLRGKQCAHILDIALGLAPSPIPDIDSRRRNSLTLKGALMKSESGRDFAPAKNPWDAMELVVSDELRERIDRKLIALSELREAIYRSETDGAKFANDSQSGGDGTYQCSMIKPTLTYWVTYKPLQGNKYEVLEAYYHRMRFQRDNEVQ